MELLDHLWRQPGEAPAVDFEGFTVDYGLLRQRITTLAEEIRRHVGEGGRVGLYLAHGQPEAEALLGVWAAGAVAVPLDTHQPLERIRTILERSGAGMLVSAGPFGLALARQLGDPWLEHTVLAAAPRAWHGPRLESLPDAVSQDVAPVMDRSPCTVLFTSGSTGTPKGVTLTRRNVDVFASHWRRELQLGPGDRVARCAALSFDLSLFDIGSTLAAGASLVPVPEGHLAFPDRLAAWAADREVTVWYSVPSLLVELVRGAAEVGPIPLRAILYAGERMSVRDVALVRQAFPAARLLNLFGPTETNVSCAHEITGDVHDADVPIGRPCPYLDVRIIDERGEESHEGELVAAGGSVMSGYWQQPELERWVTLAGGRFLCTGDRVRRDADGLLHFIGRMDRMIKIRGFRVEPAEVEAILLQDERVREAAVVAHDRNGEQALTAFVAPSDPRPSPEDLQRIATFRLPSYAVPSAFEMVRELPRTPRGKVDYPALVRLTDPGSAR